MSTTHGCAGRGKETTEYASWRKMRARCAYDGPKNKAYFARGITVCERWNKFENFLEDMGLKPSRAYSLDRIDNAKGYFPENCRWVTRAEQDRNKTNNVFIEFNEKKWCQKDFAALFGVTDATIIAKFRRGMTVDEIVDYYEKKHGKNYRRTTSSVEEALTSLATWWHNGRTSFLRVAEVIGGDNG